ncbi:MAG: DNA mismatch repair protein MutL, partial [Methanobacteriota archaeon]
MMGEIRQIPPELVRKIAAGEVITRPADVIKELVENSLDASASKIKVTIEDGGKERIIVEDNGFGIRGEDLELAFKLHTSSKISETNLFSVGTLGFRGEALASISIVSKIRCRTRHRDEEQGWELVLEGGKTIRK